MESNIVDPLALSADASESVVEEIARIDGLRDSIKADQEQYLQQHPEVVSLLNGFIHAVVEEKPPNVFDFARRHFAGGRGSADAVVVAGPSGVGKGTIVRRLMERFPQKFGFGCSHTTRARREGEKDGVHYHFVSLESMREAVAKGEFIEHAEVHGNMYGTSVAAVEDVARRGQVCLLDIDIQGAKAVKASTLLPKYVFIAPPTLKVLQMRLENRGTETPSSLSMRLKNAEKEIDFGTTEGNFDIIILNDELDRSVNELAVRLVEWFPKICI